MNKTEVPRGIRNNNPGNIRRYEKWIGMREEQTDPEFLQFDDPRFGIRAMARILKNYQDWHGVGTLRGIVERWAPPTENNTSHYVETLAARLHVTPDTYLDVRHNGALLSDLIAEIIYHENGEQPYSRRLIDEGCRLA